MKKIISLVLVLIMVLPFAGCSKKNIEKIPDLETIITMDEGDINSFLPGYKIEQLKEAWGAPDDSGASESVWCLNDVRLVVHYNWHGKVVVAGIETPTDTEK